MSIARVHVVMAIVAVHVVVHVVLHVVVHVFVHVVVHVVVHVAVHVVVHVVVNVAMVILSLNRADEELYASSTAPGLRVSVDTCILHWNCPARGIDRVLELIVVVHVFMF